MDTALRLAASFLPEGVALVVGVVLSVLRRRTDPQTAALAAAGFALHFVAVVLSTVLVYSSSGIRTAADLARYTQLGGVIGLVVIFTRLLGWILLLFALFRRLPRSSGEPQDNTPTGRHALLDAQGGQVVAEEGQSLYPDEDTKTSATGLVGAGAVGAGAGYLGGRAFGDDPFGDRRSPETAQPAGSDAPTEAVPIGRIPLRSRMPEPVTAAAPDLPDPDADADPDAEPGEAAEPGPEEVAEEDVHDPVEDEVPVPSDTPDTSDLPDLEEPDRPGPVEPADEPVVDEAVAEEGTVSTSASGVDEADVEDTGTDEADDEADVEADVDADGDVVVDEAPETADADEPATGRPPLPALTSTPVLRTDFSDDDAWEVARTAIVGPDDVEAPTNLEVVADPAYAGLSPAEAVDLATTGEAGAAAAHPCLFLVDAAATARAGSPVLVVDLRGGSADSFRCAASEVQTLETILSTTSTSFGELAGAVADDGVFRGV